MTDRTVILTDPRGALTAEEGRVVANAIDGGLLDDAIPFGNSGWARFIEVLVERIAELLGRPFERPKVERPWDREDWEVVRQAVTRRSRAL